MWRVNFCSIFVALGLCVLILLAQINYAEDTCNRHSQRGNTRTLLTVENGEENYSPDKISVGNENATDIEKLLEEVRNHIKATTTNYNFSYSGVHGLDDLVLESGGKPLKSIIVSTWRSGTTFLGEMLNAIPGTFYHFEPLLNYGIVQIRGPPDSQPALNTIKKKLNCDFYGLNDHFGRNQTDYQFTYNTRLWDYCKTNKDLCYNADFTSRFCILFPFQAMKIVRLRLHILQEIFDDANFNVKVILLIRDPRGVMQSRLRCSFCRPSTDCRQPEPLCADMVSDYEAASHIQTQYPDKFMVLRFEDFALNLNATTHRILKFFKLSLTPSLDEFLQSHTNYDKGGIGSTYRVTQNIPFKWKNRLNFTYVDEIQTTCKTAMDVWGYRMALNETHMASDEFIPIQNYTLKLQP